MESYKNCDPAALKKLLGSRPLALFDVREQEEFSRGHLLLASCAPLSRLELMAEKLAPCKKVTVVLLDGGQEGASSRALRAARVLAGLGYVEIIVLEGGMQAWREAGHVEVTGVGSLSKGFGEYVESRRNTPCLTPEEVKTLVDSGADIAIIDVRPREEYSNMNIPGGLNAPGCEVTYRFLDLAPNPQTRIIVNCAGRTRSIIGAQTLINAGVPNPVAALKGGTMNWQLSGFELEYGSLRRTAPPSARALDFVRERAAAVAERYGILFIGADELHAWQAEAAERTLYIFDVRQPEEYLAGHLPGSRNAPGGQLVQATDEYAAVRNARFVLVDDTEARAIMTAHWLVQMGLPEVRVLRGGLGGSGLGTRGLEYGPEPAVTPTPHDCSGSPQDLGARELAALLAEDGAPLVINVGFSNRHRQGHIPGAWWVARGYLELARQAAPQARSIVLTADLTEHAFLAATDAARLWPDAKVFYLRESLAAWKALGLQQEEGMPAALCAEDDIWYKPYTDINASPAAMRGYFSWEFGLVERIIEDGCVKFRE